MAFSYNATSSIDNPNNDVIVSQPPTDSISSLAWNPKSNVFAIGTWGSEVRCYQVGNNGQTQQCGSMKHDDAVLNICWNDENQIVSSGCDKTVRLWNPQNSQISVIGKHEMPIKGIKYCTQTHCAISASWDKKLKFWDPRKSSLQITTSNNNSKIDLSSVNVTSVGEILLPERCYSLDYVPPILFVACAPRKILIYDIRNPNKIIRDIESNLKHQTRCVSGFLDRKGFVIGSIEGRCAIQYIDASTEKTNNFTFKCHRDGDNVYAVNCIKFHKQSGAFATAGSDGTFNYWDKDNKQRLKPFNKLKLPITDCDFNHDGSLFAYATSYDWSQGYNGYKPTEQLPQIYLQKVDPASLKLKK